MIKRRQTYKRSLITISIITISVFLLTQCINKQEEKKAIPEDQTTGFVGSAACANCHNDIYKTHISTAHYLSSQPATDSSILGSFRAGENQFLFSPRVTVAMEKRADSFYQVAYLNGVENTVKRFDIVVGSGTKGQSYLNWTGNKLFQLPMTYFTPAHQWSNSPGYPGKVAFNRPITSRCLECHATSFTKISPPDTEPEQFDHQQILYGIDCEKCHGPGAEHVAFQSQHPGDTIAKYITNPGLFSRQQNLDLCGLCHGGRLTKTKPSFSFRSGDKLADYFTFDTAGKSALDIDVHGNQYGLLSASKCFTMSEMTCGSCHNVHVNERGQTANFSERCASCHNEKHGKICKMTGSIGASITQNCIDCHMPKQPSRSVAVQLQGQDVPTPALMRTHYIKIYPEETKKALAAFLKAPGK